MKDFGHLVFVADDPFAEYSTWRAVMRFDNGYGVSVLTGIGALCTESRPYELAVIQFHPDGSYNVVYPDQTDNDVMPFLTSDEVSDYMRIIQLFPLTFSDE